MLIKCKILIYIFLSNLWGDRTPLTSAGSCYIPARQGDRVRQTWPVEAPADDQSGWSYGPGQAGRSRSHWLVAGQVPVVHRPRHHLCIASQFGQCLGVMDADAIMVHRNTVVLAELGQGAGDGFYCQTEMVGDVGSGHWQGEHLFLTIARDAAGQIA